MKENKNNNIRTEEQKIALIAPLDWGLGHATRCIPILKQLENQDFGLIIAAEGAQMAILKQEFPNARFVNLEGYRLKYGRSALGTVLRIIAQIPKILTSIKRENDWIRQFIEENRVDLIISDNRYGFRHPSKKSVFITHQLYIKSPLGQFAERYLQKINYRFIEKFDECQIPDYEGEHNLAGALSHPSKMPAMPVKYIGPQTRCYKIENTSIVYQLLVLLSGPEPQRTLLEAILLRELKDYKGPVLFIRGLPGQEQVPEAFNQVRFYNHLPSAELNTAINASRIILSRSGYSTVMDILHLNKPCIFIPTPGQSEQAYLAKHLTGRGLGVSFSQKDFSLSEALEAISFIKVVNK